MNEDQVVQIILMILLGVGYAVASILKKADRWIKKHSTPEPPQPVRPAIDPQRPPAPEPPPSMRDVLMRELEKALHDESEQAPSAPPPPRPVAARPSPDRSRPDRPFAMPSVVASASPRKHPRGSEYSVKPRREITISGPAFVKRRDFSHLQVLRSEQDMRNAIVLHEILSPPLALRHRSPHPLMPRR